MSTRHHAPVGAHPVGDGLSNVSRPIALGVGSYKGIIEVG